MGAATRTDGLFCGANVGRLSIYTPTVGIIPARVATKSPQGILGDRLMTNEVISLQNHSGP